MGAIVLERQRRKRTDMVRVVAKPRQHSHSQLPHRFCLRLPHVPRARTPLPCGRLLWTCALRAFGPCGGWRRHGQTAAEEEVGDEEPRGSDGDLEVKVCEEGKEVRADAGGVALD